MLKSTFAMLLVATALCSSPSFAARMNNSDTIPPNCTLDPFTGKQICHIWPTCTIDPFTGKMNCPVPKAVMRRQPGA